MFIISSENRQRHKSIDKTIEQFNVVIDKNDQEGGSVDLHTTKVYRHILDHLTVPDNKNGLLKLGKQALKDENYIPICAVKNEEVVIVPAEFTTPMPIQRANIQAGNRQNITFPEGSPTIFRMSDYGYAVVTHTQFSVGDNSHEYFAGRPALMLNYSLATIQKPSVVAHELTHLRQKMYTPSVTLHNRGEYEDYKMKTELEALAFEFKLLAESMRQGETDEYTENRYKFIQLVFSVISEHQQEDSPQHITINEKVRSAFAKIGIKLFKESMLSEHERALPM